MPKTFPNNYVIIKPGIETFHYSETPFYSLMRVLVKLQHDKVKGIVRRFDREKDAIAVQFPNIKEFLWFKNHEVQRI